MQEDTENNKNNRIVESIGLVIALGLLIYGMVFYAVFVGTDGWFRVLFIVIFLFIGVVYLGFIYLSWPIFFRCRPPSPQAGKPGPEEGSWFKTWVIPLPHFHFHHEPYRRGSSHGNFFGRDEIARKLLAILRHSPNRSGSYLITGYRGVGKTSFVKKVLEDYQNGPVEISFTARHMGPKNVFLMILNGVSNRFAWFYVVIHKLLLKRYRTLCKKECPIPFLDSLIGRFLPGKRGGLILLALVIIGLLFYNVPSRPELMQDPTTQQTKDSAANNGGQNNISEGDATQLEGESNDQNCVSTVKYKEKNREACETSVEETYVEETYVCEIYVEEERKACLTEQRRAYLTKQRKADLTNPGKLSWLGVALVLFGFIHLYLRFGVPGINPIQWFRWLWRPVLVLHVNLGYKTLDTKRLLFDLVTLLALRYRHTRGILSTPRPLKIVVFLLLSIGLSGFVSKGFEREQALVKDAIQSHVFPRYMLEMQDITELTKPNPGNMPEELTDKLKDIEKIRFPSKESYLQALKFLSEVPDKNKVSSDEEEASSDGRLISIYGSLLLEKGDKSGKDDYISKEFCSTIINKEHKHHAELTFSQGTYCVIAEVMEDLHASAWLYDLDSGKNPNEGSNTTWLGERRQNLTDILHYLYRVVALQLYGLELRKPPSPYDLLVFLFTTLLLYTFYKSITAMGPKRVLRRLEHIQDRIIASDTIETGIGAKSAGLPGLMGWRRSRVFQPLDNRQAEGLLLEALEMNRRIAPWFPRADIIFVFDELDKIDPAQKNLDSGSPDLMGLNPGESVRRRKHEVEQLLSNIKNLITVAPCRFLFIAGRDMMDAHLADADEVNHLYSSLFDETIYVPSFLADESDKDAEDISSMVEQYICRRLLPRSVARYCYHGLLKERFNGNGKVDLFDLDNSYNCWRLETYQYYLKKIGGSEEEWKRYSNYMISFLQDFTYFLAYRSAGIPKKLALHFEQFVHPAPENLTTNRGIRGENRFQLGLPVSSRNRFVLIFDERDQYRVQLISHIFIMLHGETAQLIRLYGDKLALSTFSILNYLFKFHTVAFSVRDLEQMPHVLDINRAPALPQVIDVLLEKMLAPILRRMGNGIFEFQFLHYYQREIAYISQFSEADAAAFNFTLDESIGIKRHFRDLLHQHMNIQVSQGSEQTSTNLSLPSLHIILADLHGLDKEFAEAMAQYRSALQYLEPVIQGAFDIPATAVTQELIPSQYHLRESDCENEKPDFYEFEERKHSALTAPVRTLIFYVRVLLKMGLTEEQRGQYDNAAAHYFQAHRVVDYVFPRRVAGWFVVANYEQLAVLQQPAICLAALHAKKDTLPSTADAIMNRLVKRFDVYLKLAEHRDKEDDPFPSIVPNDLNRRLFRTQLLTRQAELWVMRSRFESAAVSYLKAIQGLLDGCRDILGEQNNSLDSKTGCEAMSRLAFNLSGLGDTCCAFLIHEFYRAKEKQKFAFNVLSKDERTMWKKDSIRKRVHILLKGVEEYLSPKKDEKEDSIRKRVHKLLKGVKDYLSPKKDEKDLFESWNELSNFAFKLYDLSAGAYRFAHLPAEAALSLWKLQYVLVYGLGFWEVYTSLEDEQEGEGAMPTYLEALQEVEWLFKGSSSERSEVDFLSGLAFESVYDLHRERLKQLEGEGQHEIEVVSDWITPPLVQTSRVLSWVRDELIAGQKNNSIPPFKIQDMGSFPMQPRILAQFMKARLLLRGLPEDPDKLRDRVKEKNDTAQKEVKRKLVQAFYLLVDCAENGTAYGGGIDMLTPHLSIVYYHLHRLTIVHELDSEHKENGILRDLIDAPEFRDSEKSRYLNRYYCRSRALKLLGEIIGRHVGGHEFFHHVNNRYYLHDAFSDPYINGLWAVDYGLVPLAETLIKRIGDHSKL